MATESKRSLVGRAKAALSRKSTSSNGSATTATKSAPAKKTSAKKAAPAKKASAKKAAPAKKASAKKAAPAKKASAKKAAPAKKASAKKAAPATKTAPAKKASAKKAAPATKTAPAKKASAKKAAPPKKTPATKAAPVKKEPVKKEPVKKEPVKKAAPAKKTPPAKLVVLEQEDPWTKEELAEVRSTLKADIKRLTAELADVEEDLADLIASSDGAGQDQADVGSASYERDQEMTIVFNARDMLQQSEHALERIADKTYGVCENCGNPIGKNRLMAFPRATLCMPCKQREERR